MPECCVYADDMDKVILCKGCGKEITYGEAYTSIKHFNHGGFGFCVCESCYEKEWEERRKNQE